MAEAKQEGRLGEVQGLRVSLAGAEEKELGKSTVVNLGMPAFGQIATRTSDVVFPNNGD